MSATIDVHDLKAAARGREVEINENVGGIPGECLDGKHHPCLKCGGTDRFRLVDPSTGAVFCNNCFTEKNGDFISAVQWSLDCSFPEAIAKVGDYLGMNGRTNGKPLDVIEQVCRQKKMPVDAFKQFGAVEHRRNGKTVVKMPAYGPDGEICTNFYISPTGSEREKKGLFEKGKPAGLFFPGRFPQPGEAWCVVEGPKDAAALVGLGFDAAGMPTNNLSTKFVRLFRGVHVVLVADRDRAGEEGSKLTASRLHGVAASVRIATLPAEFKETKGGDVRDVLAKRDGEQMLRQAIDDAVEWQPEKTEGSESKLQTISNVEVIEIQDEEGNTKKIIRPRSMDDIIGDVHRATGHWPRRVGSVLFVHEREQITWLENVAAFYGWLGSASAVRWHKIIGCVSKSELFERLRQTSNKYLSVENFPHEPKLQGHYYACPDIEPGNGDTLRRLLDRFAPETPIDRDLIQAAFMTTLWGGRGGERPAFVFTAKIGRGAGKTTLGESISQPVGGCIAFSAKDDVGEMKQRLLSPDALTRRVAMLDNLKTPKFSWGELESLITAAEISGKRMYVGEGQRPNTITWFITLNGASLSTDMAQRSVIIQLDKPKRSASWLTETRQFIEQNRDKLLGDIIGALRAEQHEPPKFSRWATWERDVLSRLPEPAEAQRVILERQGAVDAESEEADELQDAFAGQLARLGYKPEEHVVKIPSQVAAGWYNQATNDRQRTQNVSRILRQLHDEGRLTRIVPDSSRSQGGRGFLWVGDAASPSDGKYLDLNERIESQNQR